MIKIEIRDEKIVGYSMEVDCEIKKNTIKQ